MRRKPFGLLIQCESYRIGEKWIITIILNHLHLLFLNFILEITASIDCIISTEENNLRFISQNNWKEMPFGFCSCLWSFGTFFSPSKCFLYSFCISSFGWLGSGSLPEHTQLPSVAWLARAGKQWMLCWILHVQALVPIDNWWRLSSWFQKVSQHSQIEWI